MGLPSGGFGVTSAMGTSGGRFNFVIPPSHPIRNPGYELTSDCDSRGATKISRLLSGADFPTGFEDGRFQLGGSHGKGGNSMGRIPGERLPPKRQLRSPGASAFPNSVSEIGCRFYFQNNWREPMRFLPAGSEESRTISDLRRMQRAERTRLNRGGSARAASLYPLLSDHDCTCEHGVSRIISALLRSRFQV